MSSWGGRAFASGAQSLERRSGQSFDRPGIWDKADTLTVFSASMSEISAMIRLIWFSRLVLFAIALNAPRLSDRISKVVVADNCFAQIFKATRMASASHRVVNAESPIFASNLKMSSGWMMSAK